MTAVTTAAATDPGDGRTGCEYAEGRNQLMPSPSLTDLELVRGLRARDPKALTRVYGDYHAAVYNLCARILGDREEAKDMTQEVFLKAFSKPPAATEDVHLRAWLYRVATNACLNLIRGRRPSGPIEAETAAGERRPLRAGADGSAHRAQSRRHERALPRGPRAQGPARSRRAASWREVLEVSRPAADVLVHRARASFRRVFAGLAGKDATAPANLAVALPVLAVPAALQTLPLPAHAPGPFGAAGHGAAPMARDACRGRRPGGRPHREDRRDAEHEGGAGRRRSCRGGRRRHRRRRTDRHRRGTRAGLHRCRLGSGRP